MLSPRQFWISLRRATAFAAPIPTAMFAVGLALTAIAALSGWALWNVLAMLCLIGAGLAVVPKMAATAAQMRALVALAGDSGAPTIHGQFAEATRALADRLASVDQRIEHLHGTTGLPTREPLLARMEQDGAGVLGIVAFSDFSRLSAFDPELGERIVCQLADRIVQMVPGKRLLAHVDRSQFALWFEGAVDPEDVRRQLEAMQYALGSHITDDGLNLTPDIQIAHAAFRSGQGTADALLARTIAQAGVRGTPAAADNEGDTARDEFAFEQDLRGAIARDELHMEFQPLIDAAAGHVRGAEALLRWTHPDRGSVSPAQFIPMVERLGLADEFGLWALNASCREARRWQGIVPRQLIVAVNVSSHQLIRDDIALLLERTLARHAMPTAALSIELTESAATRDLAQTAMLFGQLRAMGIRIAIDDFGTGFSSLTALRSLQFDKIKIDREFVTEVDTRRDSQAICQSIIALGRGLGINVLAEGVERAEEYAWLRKHGCTQFQGYYFARPLSADGFAAFVRDQTHLDTLLAVSPRADQDMLARKFAS